MQRPTTYLDSSGKQFFGSAVVLISVACPFGAIEPSSRFTFSARRVIFAPQRRQSRWGDRGADKALEESPGSTGQGAG
jgi:hypothetical protein